MVSVELEKTETAHRGVPLKAKAPDGTLVLNSITRLPETSQAAMMYSLFEKALPGTTFPSVYTTLPLPHTSCMVALSLKPL